MKLGTPEWSEHVAAEVDTWQALTDQEYVELARLLAPPRKDDE